MKSSFLQTAVCAIAVITLVSNATAQTSRGTAVAVLDVSRVFKEHTTFTKKMDSLKAEAKEFERSINQQQQEIVKRAKEVSEEYSSSSLEFKRAEAELAQRQSDLRVKLQLKRKEMLEREAKLYYETYQRMLQIVNGLADKHQLSLVLRFDSTPIDSDDRAVILNKINQFVVMQRRLDLTNAVIQQLDGIASR